MTQFGMFVDNSKQESFKVTEGKSYTLSDGLPYSTKNSIEHYTHMSIFQYPFLFDGYFINLKKTELPDVDFDVIFLTIEKHYDEFSTRQIQKKYPNAKIFGVLKEIYFIDERLRCKALAECDQILIPFSHKYMHYFYQKNTGKETIWLPHPYDIDYLNNKFYKQERTHDIFAYISPTLPELRRSNTEQFSNYISNKYKLSIKHVLTDTWPEFMEEISTCKFLFNLDPTLSSGNTGIQAALLGLHTLGGNNDSITHLFPNSCGTNFDQLEEIFSRLNSDNSLYLNSIQNSYQLVNEIYGMESVKSKILDLYDKY
tara:strand:+ start:852 stop:1790 length:939 start_codon:yes stop_codon:yes gene_type:complete